MREDAEFLLLSSSLEAVESLNGYYVMNCLVYAALQEHFLQSFLEKAAEKASGPGLVEFPCERVSLEEAQHVHHFAVVIEFGDVNWVII